MDRGDGGGPEIGHVTVELVHLGQRRRIDPRSQREPTRVDLGQGPRSPHSLPSAQSDRLEGAGGGQTLEGVER